MNRFKVIKQIGRGAFGVALLVERKPNTASSKTNDLSKTTTVPSGRYVIKKIDVSCLSKQESAEARNEVHVLSQLAHIKHGNPFIIGYHSAFLESGSLHILLDYAEHGDLSQAITKTKNAKRQFRQPQVLDWFVQISSALKFVHSKNILHRDLKTQNVFLDKYWKVKLGDFGIAKVLNSTTAKANTMVGTPYYLSPELCEDKPYDRKSDIWALGCILYELCTLEHAFKGQNMCALVLRIVKGKYSPIKVGTNGGYTLELKNLVDRLLSRNPKGRPYVHQILRMKFILKHIRAMEMHGRLDAERQIVQAVDEQEQEAEEEEGNGGGNGGNGGGNGGGHYRITSVSEDVDGSEWNNNKNKGSGGGGGNSGSPELNTRGRMIAKQKRRKSHSNESNGSNQSNHSNESTPGRRQVNETEKQQTEREEERRRRRRAPRSQDIDEEARRMREMRERQDQLLESSFIPNKNKNNNESEEPKRKNSYGGSPKKRIYGKNPKHIQVETAWKQQLSNYVGSALNHHQINQTNQTNQTNQPNQTNAASNRRLGRHPGVPIHERVRADIGKSGQKMESRDPTGVQARQIERRRRKEKDKRSRIQRQEYRNSLKERSKEFKKERAAIKYKKKKDNINHAKNLRNKIKNAKSRVDVKSLRKKFKNNSNNSSGDSDTSSNGSNGSENSSVSFFAGSEVVTPVRKQGQDRMKERDTRDTRDTASGSSEGTSSATSSATSGGRNRNTKQPMSQMEIDKRKYRASNKSPARNRGGVLAHSKKKQQDISVEIFVHPDYIQNNEEDEGKSSLTEKTGKKVVQQTKNEMKESYVMDTTIGGSSPSLQEAFEQRRRKREERNGGNSGGSGSGSGGGSGNERNGSRRSSPNKLSSSPSKEKNPFRTSATNVMNESSSLTDVASRNSRLQDGSEEDEDDYGDSDDAPLPWEDGSNLLGTFDLEEMNEYDQDIDNNDAVRNNSNKDNKTTSNSNGSNRSNRKGNGLLKRVNSHSRDDLANQLRQCAELADLQGSSDVNEEEMDLLEESYAEKVDVGSADPPPVITLSTRCEQLRSQLEVEIGNTDVFKQAYQYLHSVMDGDDMIDPLIHGFHDVLIQSNESFMKMTTDEVEELKIEMLLLIHLEGALLKAQRPR